MHLSILSQLLLSKFPHLQVEPRVELDSFQFFPSCSLERGGGQEGVGQEPESLAEDRGGGFQFFPSCSALEALSQLYHQARETFNSFPVAARARAARDPLAALDFQFFPSCSLLALAFAASVALFAAFNSFPVAAQKGTRRPRARAAAAPFNSFPVAAGGDIVIISVSERTSDFQFFPSCSSRRSLRLGRTCREGPFNSFPVAAREENQGSHGRDQGHRRFQFFPSCSSVIRINLEELYDALFQFFPSCSARISSISSCSGVSFLIFSAFNSFPVAAR